MKSPWSQKPCCRTRQWLICSAVLIVYFFPGTGVELVAEELRNPSVGVTGRIEQIVLPGPELQVKKIVDPDEVMIVRIDDLFPHGDALRYDIEFYGLEPGKYNLSDYLEPVGGLPAVDLPPIEVEIRSLLPPGQIEPNQLKKMPGPWLGGYTLLAILAVLGWLVGMILIFVVARKKKPVDAIQKRPQTFADLLRPRLEAALKGNLDAGGHAELERMLIAFWQQRLGLETEAPAQALQRIKSHPTSGELILQLERWMHDPLASRELSLDELLRPYESIELDDENTMGSPSSAPALAVSEDRP